MTLDEFAAEVRERLSADTQAIRNPDGDVQPALFYLFGGEAVRRFKIPWSWFESSDSKRVMARAIEQATRTMRPRFIGFECTTWMVLRDLRETPLEESRQIRASEQPDRQERLTLVAFSRDRFAYWDAPITRDGRNPPVYGEWVDYSDADHIEGQVFAPLQRGMAA